MRNYTYGVGMQSGDGTIVPRYGVLGRALGMMTGQGRAVKNGSLGEGSTIGLSYDAMIGLVIGAGLGIFYVKQNQAKKRTA